MRQILNNFTIIKSITIILKFMPNLKFSKYNINPPVYVSRIKKNLIFFLFTLTHTNYLSRRRQHFTLFSSSFSFLCSSPTISLYVTSLSLALCNIKESFTNFPWFVCFTKNIVVSFLMLPPKWKSFYFLFLSFFFFLISHSIFPLPIGRTFELKPSNSCIIVYL